ncbi:uncharacterized protein LOC132983118 [Labrus mixtus]|uniref:uncharacterized protein LOC132983118 n=1 Tax=Labrus mixtus TaxID=508554 RepID=UPI0029BFE343|nr:uncharacterized protein LOC132983118 [Labrus mixtus]
MSVPLLVCLSAVVLQCVSAGGVYCAKTARARAAALGLDYPGVHGAPGLYAPAHEEMQPRTMTQTSKNNGHEVAETGHDMASFVQYQPGVRSLDDSLHEKAPPRSLESTFLPSHGIYDPEYPKLQGLTFPRGRSAINHRPNFEQVKHVAPEAPSRPDLLNLNSQGRSEPPSFVNSGYDLVVDESVPNRRGMYLSGPPLPRSKGRATYQRGDGPGGELPVLGSAGFPNKKPVRVKTIQGPAVGKQKWKRFPVRFVRPLHRSIHFKMLNQGIPSLRRSLKPKSSDSIKSH